jgi:hypothetical protein
MDVGGGIAILPCTGTPALDFVKPRIMSYRVVNGFFR